MKPKMKVWILDGGSLVIDRSQVLWHIDVGTASGIGLLLGDVRVSTGGGLGPAGSALEYPLDLRGSPLDLAALPCPQIERSIGIDLDPPDLREQIDGCPFAPRCPEVEDRCRTGVIPLVVHGDRAAACVHVPGYDEVLRHV